MAVNSFNTAAGPLPAIEAAIADGLLERNASQLLAAQHLQELWDHLNQGAEPATSSRGVGIIGRLFQPKTDRVSAPQGAYLVGGVGIGKTMLMDMFADGLPHDLVWREHFHKFMFSVQDRLLEQRLKAPGSDPLLAVAHQIATQVRVVCLDEFFVNNVADAMILQRLFQTLFEAGVALVTTSNVVPDRLYEGGLQRDRFVPFIDLLVAKTQVIQLAADRDYRQAVVHLSDLYISPLGRTAETHMQDAFRVLNGGHDGKVGSIKVRDRTLKVPLMGRSSAFFRFEELCGQPLGAEDYNALASQFANVLITDVPELSDERLSEVKRFVTLIDVMYDTQRLLVVSAAARPEQLYRGTQAPEFERTASRLTEMQSNEYLCHVAPEFRLMVH